MAFYVYIIQSFADQSFYKGFSLDPVSRLAAHNKGDTLSTKNKGPWKLVYVEQFDSKKEALVREKNLKKADRNRIQALLSHTKNIVHQFPG
jgi:putative endonuclease